MWERRGRGVGVEVREGHRGGSGERRAGVEARGREYELRKQDQEKGEE